MADQTTTSEDSAGNNRALLVIDVQNDFCEGGSLAVAGGAEVATRVSTYLASHADDYRVVIASRDWHQDPGSHFSTNPDFIDSWPAHCVAGTAGAAFHPNLNVACDFEATLDACVSKGAFDAAYSAFEGADSDGVALHALLQQAGVGDVDVVGLATDHCDRATALDAVKLGYEVRLLAEMCAGVDDATTAAALAEMASRGVSVVSGSAPDSD